jgi:hypothetical protein
LVEIECIGGLINPGDVIDVNGISYPMMISGGTMSVANCVSLPIRNNSAIVYRINYAAGNSVCLTPGNTYDEVRLINFNYNPGIFPIGGYDYTEQLYMGLTLVGSSFKQTAIINPPTDFGAGCPNQTLDLVVRFYVESVAPTPTPTNTGTPTPTPTITPNPVCPQSLNITSSNSGIIDVATYTRSSIGSGTTFDYGYLVETSSLNGYFVFGTAPDGNNYPIFEFVSGDANVLYRKFNTSNTDLGWWGVEQFPNPLTSGILSGAGGQRSFGFDYTEISGIRFIKAGSNTGGSIPVVIYVEYPIACPTPTPTSTPTTTSTPTNTPTPSSSPSVANYFILAENGDIITAQNGNGIEYQH